MVSSSRSMPRTAGQALGDGEGGRRPAPPARHDSSGRCGLGGTVRPPGLLGPPDRSSQDQQVGPDGDGQGRATGGFEPPRRAGRRPAASRWSTARRSGSGRGIRSRSGDGSRSVPGTARGRSGSIRPPGAGWSRQVGQGHRPQIRSGARPQAVDQRRGRSVTMASGRRSIPTSQARGLTVGRDPIPAGDGERPDQGTGPSRAGSRRGRRRSATDAHRPSRRAETARRTASADRCEHRSGIAGGFLRDGRRVRVGGEEPRPGRWHRPTLARPGDDSEAMIRPIRTRVTYGWGDGHRVLG